MHQTRLAHYHMRTCETHSTLFTLDAPVKYAPVSSLEREFWQLSLGKVLGALGIGLSGNKTQWQCGPWQFRFELLEFGWHSQFTAHFRLLVQTDCVLSVPFSWFQPLCVKGVKRL